MSAGTAYVGDWAGRVVALRLADGRPRWRFQARRSRYVYAGQIVGSPAFAAGTVYVGAGGTLYALRAADGRLRWQRRLGSRRAEIESSPTLAAGLVLVGTDVLNRPGYRAGLWALDARTGRLRWRFDAEAGRPPRGCGDVWSSPAVDLARRTVYVGTGSCNRPRRGWTPYTEALVALDRDTGRPRWAFQPHRPGNHDLDFAGRPSLFSAGGRPLVGIGGKDGVYYALTPAGRLVWKRRLTLWAPKLCSRRWSADLQAEPSFRTRQSSSTSTEPRHEPGFETLQAAGRSNVSVPGSVPDPIFPCIGMSIHFGGACNLGSAMGSSAAC